MKKGLDMPGRLMKHEQLYPNTQRGWSIYLHLPPRLPTCGQIDHTLSVWDINAVWWSKSGKEVDNHSYLTYSDIPWNRIVWDVSTIRSRAVFFIIQSSPTWKTCTFYGSMENVKHRSESRWLATPKRWQIVRSHDKPRLMMGVAPSTFQVV